jgi:hypothetical protein
MKNIRMSLMQRMLVMKQYNMLFVCEMPVIDTITSLWHWNLILRDNRTNPKFKIKPKHPHVIPILVITCGGQMALIQGLKTPICDMDKFERKKSFR